MKGAAASSALVDAQKALEEMEPPDRAHDKEPDHHQAQDDGLHRKRLDQNPEVVAQRGIRPDDQEEHEQAEGEPGRTLVGTDLAAPTQKEAARRFQEQEEQG